MAQKELKIKDIKDTLIEQPWSVRKVPLEKYRLPQRNRSRWSLFRLHEANSHLRHM